MYVEIFVGVFYGVDDHVCCLLFIVWGLGFGVGDYPAFSFYLCTLPLPSPLTKSFTSANVAWFKSPGMVCFMALAATPNSAESAIDMPVTKP
jgi:hypothetical protein